MPHIIVRFMAIRKQSEVKKSAAIAITWNLVILSAAVAAGILGRVYLGSVGIELGAPGAAGTGGGETVFIEMARRIFPAVIAGILLSAILSATICSTDYKLLVSFSSFTADVYKPFFRRNASQKEMIWVGRFVIVAIAVVATAIAISPGCGTIMGIVANAWGVFGAAFGPSMLLALYWKRFNLSGAIAGILTGTGVAVLWIVVPALENTGVFGIVPAFFLSLFVAIGVTLATKAPGKEVEELFEKALAIND